MFLIYYFQASAESASAETTKSSEGSHKVVPSQPFLRLVACLSTSFEFALALRLSNLTEAIRVLSFLLLPFHQAFDPSLVFLALGAMPLSILLYQFARNPEIPRLGGTWSVPKGGKVDSRLLIGAALFGVGWGMSGICPGPGFVNLGRAIASGLNITQSAAWLACVALGGFLVPL